MSEHADDVQIEHVNTICPACYMTVKPPVTRENAITWVDGKVRRYAHRKCEDGVREKLGVDNGGTMVATD